MMNARGVKSCALAVAMALAFGTSSARADLFYFDTYRDGQNAFGGNNFGTVDVEITNGGQTATIAFSLGVNAQNVAYEIDKFGFNYTGPGSLSASQISGPDSNWSASTSSTQLDGFGKFYAIDNTTNQDSLQSGTITITAATGQTFTTGSFEAKTTMSAATPAYFAAHMTQGLPSTYYMGVTTNNPPPQVAAPEPSAMALATLGTLGFLGYGVRRYLKKSIQ